MIVFLAGLVSLSFTSSSAAKVNAVADTTFNAWPNTVYYFFGKNLTTQILGPNAPYSNVKIHITAVDRYTLYVNGTKIGTDDKWQTVETYTLPSGTYDDLNIAVQVDNFGLGHGNGLMVDIEAGPDRFGTSTLKRRSGTVIKSGQSVLTEFPARWYYFNGDIETAFNSVYKRKDWYKFDRTLFDNAATLGFKWVMLGKMGDIGYMPDNSVEIVTGYPGDIDTGSPANGGISLRKIDGEDIALKKPAQEEKTVEGDLATGYSYNVDPVSSTKQVDLEQIYRVNKMVIYTGGSNPADWPNNSVKGYAAQISIDSFRFSEVGIIHNVGVTNKDNGGYDYAEVSFPDQVARYVRYNITESRLYFPNIGEIMVYGTGYTYNGLFESSAIDLNSPTTQKNFKTISWTGDVLPGTKIVVQTATRYLLADGTTYSAWSDWSKEHTEKTFDFDSPEPATEFKYKVTLSTDNVDRTPVFKTLNITYSKVDQPLASGRSSILPTAVPMGADTSFVYKLEYTLASGTPVQDIKKVVISVPNFAAVDSVFSSEFNKLVPFTSYSTSDSLYVTLNDSLVNSDKKSPDLLKIYLRTNLLVSQHDFISQVYNSRNNDGAGGISVWQNTDESWTVSTNTVLPSLLTDVKALPKAFTPNGDNINAFTVFEFTLAKVEAPVKIKVFSTDGTLVRALFDGRLSPRDYRVPDGPTGLKTGTVADAKKLPGYWDGKNKDGDLVPPGIYIYQIIVKTDEGEKSKTGTVAVAY